jgi:hypothetical protein
MFRRKSHAQAAGAETGRRGVASGLLTASAEAIQGNVDPDSGLLRGLV